MKIKAFFKLMRPKHYIKNLLIFAPIVFDKTLFNLDFLSKTIISTIGFCFLSSIIYIINDITDIEKDRLHSTKRFRLLASGVISVKIASVLGCGIFLLAILLIFIPNIGNALPLMIAAIYFINNLLYSLGLKNHAVFDVFMVMFGFVLRLSFGASIIQISLSHWMYLTLMSGALFLAIGKRRNEKQQQSGGTRNVLEEYNDGFLDKAMYMNLAMMLVFYSLWTVDSSYPNQHKYFVFTIPLVIAIFMKYSLHIEKGSSGDPVNALFENKALVLMTVIYGVSSIIILYI